MGNFITLIHRNKMINVSKAISKTGDYTDNSRMTPMILRGSNSIQISPKVLKKNMNRTYNSSFFQKSRIPNKNTKISSSSTQNMTPDKQSKKHVIHLLNPKLQK